MKKLPTPHPDTPTLDELREAFARLDADEERRWGTMTAPQMVKHCRQFVDLYLGRVRVAFPIRTLARMIGPFFLRRALVTSPTATPKNLSTMPAIRARAEETLDLDEERTLLLDAFTAAETLEGVVPHPLYGSMHAEDVRALVRHHTAHHAHQFGMLEHAPSPRSNP